ncbi:MAG: trypsin-like peptidase domain-containing protein [Oscillibacter sp.]|nr:trypsin-like peptidase domain-containing protein [Oscillibacter sp.]
MEENRMNDPREVVEVYRRPPPREVVEVYTRPLPEGMLEAEWEEWYEMRRRRRRRGLVLFLVCLVLSAALAALAWFRPWEEKRPSAAPAPSAGTGETDDITIPVWPVGQGAAFMVEEQGETSLTIQEVYRRVNPSVVTVMVQIGEAGDYTRLGVGTGVIFTSDGYIITNYHVLEGGTDCMVALDTGVTYSAMYVAGDEENDLAVLKIEGEDLPAATFADSNDLVVGDTVYAIGNPLGVELRGTLTDGIVSAINRDVDVDGRIMTLIQTNAALNSGNSGGPLINQYGQVVGINVVKMVGNYQNNNVEGLGFAIPSASMERIITDLLTYGELQPKPSLGLEVIQVGEVLSDGTVGIYVQTVNAGSAAEAAGIRVGDYVVWAGGLDIRYSVDLLRARDRYHLGDTFPITVWREGELLEFELLLEQEFAE